MFNFITKSLSFNYIGYNFILIRNPSPPPKMIAWHRHGNAYATCIRRVVQQRKNPVINRFWKLITVVPSFSRNVSPPPGKRSGLYIISGHVYAGVHAKKIKILTPSDPTQDTYRPSRVLLRGNNVETKCQNNVFSLFFFLSVPLPIHASE